MRPVRVRRGSAPGSHGIGPWLKGGPPSAGLLRPARLQPFVKYETLRFVSGSPDIGRYGAGANIYLRGQNLKWTLQYNRLLPLNGSPLKASNEVTMQLQLFYF